MLERMMILLVILLSIDVCIAFAAAFIPGPSGFVLHVRPGIYVFLRIQSFICYLTYTCAYVLDMSCSCTNMCMKRTKINICVYVCMNFF